MRSDSYFYLIRQSHSEVVGEGAPPTEEEEVHQGGDTRVEEGGRRAQGGGRHQEGGAGWQSG